MAYEYYFLDETSIKYVEKGITKSRTIVFIGSQAELQAWLPKKYDPADFTFLVDGTRWAGTDFFLDDVTADAIDRFEYTVKLKSKNFNDKGGPGGGGGANKEENSKTLLETTNSSIEDSTFAITAKMAGFKIDPTTNEYIIDSTYTEATDSPFNEVLGIANINLVLKTETYKYKSYLSGGPEEHDADRKGFTGVVQLNTYKGRALSQSMDETDGFENNVYSEWNRYLQLPPDGYTWRTTWKGI